MARLEPMDVAMQYASGIDAVKKFTASFGEGDWSATVCGKWTAVETLRHLVGVVGWYDEWLDRALDGDSTALFVRANSVAVTMAWLSNMPGFLGRRLLTCSLKLRARMASE